MGGALWRNRLLLTLVFFHLACGLAISHSLEQPFTSGTLAAMLAQLKLILPLFVLLLVYGRYRWGQIYIKPDNQREWFIADLKRIVLDGERIATGVLAFLAFVLFCATYSFLKDSIPLMVPFSWDPAFAELDRMLHGGTDPWRLLLPVFGNPLATTAVNTVYHFWFFLMYFIVLWACFDTRNFEKSAIFLVAYVLTWVIGGNLFATLLSSAGPVFYADAGFGDTFVPLMERLRAVNQVSPVWALDVQRILLDGYLNNGPIKGISAMLSMHVGSTVVMTLFCFSHNRKLGWAMVAFTGLIVIGSVHLAWHYAVDSYFAIVIALVCWALARWLLRWFPTQV